MLVLTRKAGERIQIEHNGEMAELVVIRIEGDKLRLGLEAPQSFKFVRTELLDRKNDAHDQPPDGETSHVAPKCGECLEP